MDCPTHNNFNDAPMYYGADLVIPANLPTTPQKGIPPGVGENSKRWRPWVWLCTPIDIVAILFLLARFFYVHTSGWEMDSYADNLIQITLLFITFMLLTYQLIITLCLFISLCQSDGSKTVRYCKMWMYGSYLVNIYTGIILAATIMKPEWLLLLLLTSGIFVFRMLAFVIVKVFSKYLAHEVNFWETRFLQEQDS